MTLLPYVMSGLGLGAIYAMSGVGLVILYRASATVNFAFGAVGAIGAFCAWTLIQHGVPIAVAWTAGVLVSTLVSYGYGHLISSRLVEREKSVRAIATLGLALFLLGAITTIWPAVNPRRLTLPLDRMSVIVAHFHLSYTRIAALSFAVLSVAGLTVLIDRTRIGLAMRALASNRSLSAVIGIPVGRTDAFAWAVSGAFAGVAGLLMADLVTMSPYALVYLVIPGIAAAIIGGLTSLRGAFVGGMVCGLAEAMSAAFPMVTTYRSAAPYVIAMLVIAVGGKALLREAE